VSTPSIFASSCFTAASRQYLHFCTSNASKVSLLAWFSTWFTTESRQFLHFCTSNASKVSLLAWFTTESRTPVVSPGRD
jgi:hypothetical protein